MITAAGMFSVVGLETHDSVFYRFSPSSTSSSSSLSTSRRAASNAEAVWWPAATPAAAAAAAVGALQERSAAEVALQACERVQGAGAGECAALTTCVQRCAAAGHCCTGTTSGYQHPSCAQGCMVAAGTKSVQACDAVCAAADGKCSWTFNKTSMSNCGSCASTCCNAVVKGECSQGCSFGFP